MNVRTTVFHLLECSFGRIYTYMEKEDEFKKKLVLHILAIIELIQEKNLQEKISDKEIDSIRECFKYLDKPLNIEIYNYYDKMLFWYMKITIALKIVTKEDEQFFKKIYGGN
jgi:hypothetical protein